MRKVADFCWQQREALALAALVLVGIAVRLPYLEERSLWFDEASSWWTATRSWPDLWASIRHNVHAPLYYVLLKGWIGLVGESAAALRSLSILFGALTIAAMFLVGKELQPDSQPRWLGLLLAALVAVSPCQVQASIETKMYSLGTALVALSTWFVLRVSREPRHERWWPVYALCTVAFLYTHPYAVFSVAAQYLFLGAFALNRAFQGQQKHAAMLQGFILKSALPALLLYAPWLPVFRSQAERVGETFSIRPTSLAKTLAELTVPERLWWPDDLDLIMFGVVVVLSLNLWRPRPGQILMITSFLTPFVLAAAVSQWIPIWHARYFRFAQLFFLAALAVALGRLPWSRPRLALSWTAAGFSMWGCVLFWEGLDIPHKPGMRGAMRQIAAESGGDATVIVLAYAHLFPAKYYAAGIDVRMLEYDKREVHLRSGPPVPITDLVSHERPGSLVRAGAWMVDSSPWVPEAQGAGEDCAPLDHVVEAYYRFDTPICFGRCVTRNSER